MSKRSWALFALTGLLWGVPYLFIKVAVDGFSPAIIVCGRTLIGAAILIPLAMREKSLKSALRGIKYVIPYAFLEMVGPWILITTAEQEISSGLTALLVATVPIWATALASFFGDHSVWHHKRLIGLVVGFIGVIAVVGFESIFGSSNPLAIAMVLLASMLYAYAVIMITRALPDVSGVAINAVAMVFTFFFYLPISIVQWPTTAIPLNATLALIGLGVFSTALAFPLYFALVKDIGQARGSLVTYINTAIAIVLGVVILSEPMTLGIIIGLPLILYGSYLASRKNIKN